MSLTVALVTDVHHGPDSEYVWGSAALPLFEGTLRELEPLNPDLLIDLGDRINNHQLLDGQPLPGNVFFSGADVRQAHPRGHETARRVMECSCRVKLAVSGHAHWNYRVTVGGIPYLTLDALVPLAELQEKVGNYGLFTLTDGFAQLEVFGRSPWRVRLELEARP